MLSKIYSTDYFFWNASGFFESDSHNQYGIHVDTLMLQALLITFREGIESFLIIGVIVAYLRKTRRRGLIRGVHLGLGLSVFTCTVGAYLWMEVPNHPLYEGVASLVAAVFVGGMLVQMLRMGRQLKADIESRIDRAAGQEIVGQAISWRAVVGVTLVTTLLITREGLEAVFFIGVQAFAAKAAPLAIGASLGVVLAGLLAWLWTRYSHRLQIDVVLRVTAVFLALFLLQLVVYGVHELAESGVIHGSEDFHTATERFGPHGDIGQALAYSLAGAPLLYLLFNRRKPQTCAATVPNVGR